MNDTSRTMHRSFFALIFGMFFLSGVSGLMYEVVWVRMLTRVLGSTAYATSTVLAVYMAGLALGSLLVGRFADRMKNPLVCYAILELAIGASAFLSLGLPKHLIPLYQGIYEWADGSRAVLTLGQVVVTVIVLLLPTTLMGATLPTLSALGSRGMHSFGKCVGTLYAVNTLGAVLGVVAAGFLSIGTIGETATIQLGAVLNAVASVAAFALARTYSRSPKAAPADEKGSKAAPVGEQILASRGTYPRRVRWAVLLAFAVSGFVALANEVVWGRMLILCQGTSIYAFSSMLAVVLSGIGLGSLVMGWFVERIQDPLRQLIRVQLAIGVVALISLHVYGWFGDLPRPSLRYGSDLYLLIVAPVVMLAPMALLWGITFPLAARCYSQSLHEAGRDVSELYAWNTVGSILGALAGGFWLLPKFGSSTSGAALAMVSGLLGALLLAVHPAGFRMSLKPFEVSALALCVILLATVGDPYRRVIEKRIAPWFGSNSIIHAHVEEIAGTATAFGIETPRFNKYQQLWINGEEMTFLCTETKLMAHLPISLVDEPRDVLVICFGMGTTVRSASRHPGLEIWSVELLGGIVDCMQYFYADAPQVLASPNVHAVVDDGRNFLLVHDQQFDVITVDPAPPLYAAGAVNLYTKEFFDLVKTRLRPGGIFCLWIPPYNKTDMSMVVKTFLDSFEHVSAWSGPAFKGLYMLGSQKPILNVQEKIHRAYREQWLHSDMVEWDRNCDTPEKLLDLYIAVGDELRDLYRDVPVVTDDLPLTEFPLFRALKEKNPDELNGDVLREDLRIQARRRDRAQAAN